MISIKKLATVGAAAGLLFGSAMPVFAGHWRNDDDLNITQSNSANVTNGVLANSNTGNQSMGGNGGSHGDLQSLGGGQGHRGRGNLAIGTGDATTWVEIDNKVNKNIAKVDACECFDDVTITQSNSANVTNRVLANSNTGNQSLGSGSNKAIHTGAAYTGVTVSNKVNKNVAIVN